MQIPAYKIDTCHAAASYKLELTAFLVVELFKGDVCLPECDILGKRVSRHGQQGNIMLYFMDSDTGWPLRQHGVQFEMTCHGRIRGHFLHAVLEFTAFSHGHVLVVCECTAKCWNLPGTHTFSCREKTEDAGFYCIIM